MRIVTFGELMLRLAPQGYERFVQANSFGATYGGGEANVAVSLANFGMDACFVSKLPEHEIGQSALNSLRRFGVDTSFIARGGNRIGIYFLEKGASQRPSKVIYDRTDSSMAQADPGDFNWPEILDRADWFHFTGITPALSERTAGICLQALKAAASKGITTSCDINYRRNLWSREKAMKVMTPLMKYVDVCIANEEDAGDVFGIYADSTDIGSGILNRKGYMEVARKLSDKFGFKKVAITLRQSVSASDNNWSAMLYCDKEYYKSREYKVHIVDRVGGGDSFAGGLIFSLLNGHDLQRSVEFAAAASCLKHSVEGDSNMVTAKEVESLVNGYETGRVLR
ncbi:MAG: PfkB family carbohydrate kinase [Saccharofermentanales bacterium]